MTDIAALAKRLRTNPLLRSDVLAAADALEAQAKEIKTCQQTELAYITRVADAQREYSEMKAKLKVRIAELKKELNAWHESANWPEKSPGRIRARIAELEAALRFYADPHKFTDCNGDDVQVPDFYDELDFGATARAALKGEKG